MSEVRSTRELLEALLAFVDRVVEGPLTEFEPPGEFDYSNEEYDLLGVLVERASGQDWQTYVAEQILQPAGMDHSSFEESSAGVPLAVGYTERDTSGRYYDDGRRPAPGYRFPYVRPAGGMISTAEDLAAFARALLGGRILPPSWRDRMLSAQGEMPDLPGMEVRRGYGV